MSGASESARILDILLPNGGDLISVSEAFFDESYEDRAPRVMCVAAYLFTKARSVEFEKRWNRYLRKKGLPYFHANECAHSCGIFEGRDDTYEVSRKLIDLTKEYSDFGVTVALNRDVYEEVCQGHIMFPTAYAYALTNCLYGIAVWRDVMRRTEPTAFFFEQGHAHATDAHQFISFMLKSDHLPGRLGYRAHSFVPKETPQVQASDLLAWLWRLNVKRIIDEDPRPVRRDLIALQRPQDHFQYFDRQRIEAFRDSVKQHSADAEVYVRQLATQYNLPAENAEYVANWIPDYRDMRATGRSGRRVR
jgi:HD-GYP domain-containing protein (c-di-GMP phosphodiesterase class II)